MRTDPNKSQEFVLSKEWESSGKLQFYEVGPDGKKRSNSFSGGERNHLYLNRGGESFVDVSKLSGTDLPQDGRSFAYFDYDQDGWMDIALVSANAPQLQILHNELAPVDGSGGNYVRLKFRGSNESDEPAPGRSNRDGYGARLIAELPDGTTLYREHHCGAGMAAQNVKIMHLGIGDAEVIDAMNVVWPSGVVQKMRNLKAGETYDVREPID